MEAPCAVSACDIVTGEARGAGKVVGELPGDGVILGCTEACGVLAQEAGSATPVGALVGGTRMEGDAKGAKEAVDSGEPAVAGEKVCSVSLTRRRMMIAWREGPIPEGAPHRVAHRRRPQPRVA